MDVQMRRNFMLCCICIEYITVNLWKQKGDDSRKRWVVLLRFLNFHFGEDLFGLFDVVVLLVSDDMLIPDLRNGEINQTNIES